MELIEIKNSVLVNENFGLKGGRDSKEKQAR